MSSGGAGQHLPSSTKPATFLLVDFENVQSDDLSALAGGSFGIKVFLGAHQTKVPVALARALQTFGPHAEYIPMQGSGHNALDFHIAYYLGRLAVQHPQAHFQIVSKDTGFDPLLNHLRAQKISCERLLSLAALCERLPSATTAAGDRVALVIADLIKRQAARPRTVKTLNSTIQAFFRNQLSEDELRQLLDNLVQRGVVKVSDGKLSYDLPKTA